MKGYKVERYLFYYYYYYYYYHYHYHYHYSLVVISQNLVFHSTPILEKLSIEELNKIVNAMSEIKANALRQVVRKTVNVNPGLNIN